MPHFIIDCTENVLKMQEPQVVLEAVFEAAFSTGLFVRNDIKVRLNPFVYSLVQGASDDFIHVFGNIKEGRNGKQKAALSKVIVSKLNSMFLDVPIISMNSRDFTKESYYNKTMM